MIILAVTGLLEIHRGAHIGNSAATWGISLDDHSHSDSICPNITVKPFVDERCAVVIPKAVVIRNSSKTDNRCGAIPVYQFGRFNTDHVETESVFNGRCCSKPPWSPLGQNHPPCAGQISRVSSDLRDFYSEEQMMMNHYVESWSFPDIIEVKISRKRFAYSGNGCGAGVKINDMATSRDDKRALIKLKLLFDGVERFGRRIASNDTGVGRFFNLWILPNDFSKLTLHHRELAVVNTSYVKANEYRSGFKNHFPQWCLIGFTAGSFSLALYGWWHLRNQSKMVWGFCWWCLGVALWVYTISLWLKVSP